MTPQQASSTKHPWMFAVLLGGALLAGCSENDQVKVTSRYGAGVRLSGLGPAFAWAPSAPTDAANPPLGNAELSQLIRTSVEKELAAKGFAQNPAGPADFWIDYRISRQDKTDSNVNPHGEVYQQGSLVLDVLDPGSGKLIWRGVAQARILYRIAPEVREKRIKLAIQGLMKQFPLK